MSFNGCFTLYLAKTDQHTHRQREHPHSDKVKASAVDSPKQVPQFCMTAKQDAKMIVHLENGICRKPMPYH